MANVSQSRADEYRRLMDETARMVALARAEEENARLEELAAAGERFLTRAEKARRWKAACSGD